MSQLSVPLLSHEQMTLEVETGLGWFYKGPDNTVLYTLLQGIITVLTLKEIIIVTRYFVKGSSGNLRINRVILWQMVEDWDDIFKVFRDIFFPKALISIPSSNTKKHTPLNILAFSRYLLAGLIALWLFIADISLVFSALPNRSPQDAQTISGLAWDNSGEIPLLTESTEQLIRGSFSKTVQLRSISDDVEFISLPSVSVERTNYKDFRLQLPEYQGKLLTCNSTEGWRIICQVYCDKRYYQYKLRLDVNARDQESAFFVPTTKMTVTSGINKLENYVDAIEEQLKIKVDGWDVNGNSTYFEIYSKLVNETVMLAGEEELMHDAVVSLFLGSIRIKATTKGSLYYERMFGERAEHESMVKGTIAISQRPFLPLLGSLLVYGILQTITIILQTRFGLHAHTAETIGLLEVTGCDCMYFVANLDVADKELKYSKWQTEEGNWVGYAGFLPGRMMWELRHWFNPNVTTEQKRNVYGLIDETEMRDLISYERKRDNCEYEAF